MTQMSQIADAIEDFSGRFSEFRDRHDSEMSSLGNRLEKLELKADMPNLGGTVRQSPIMSAEFGKFLRSGKEEYLRQMSVNITTDSDGGYLHVRELDDAIIAAVGEINPLMAEMRQVNIDANEYRQVFTTSRSATGRAAESDSRTETTTAKMDVSDVQLFDLYAYPTVTNEILHSTVFDVQNWLIGDIADAFTEALGREFVSGDGVKQSVGILHNTSTNALGASPDLPWGSIYSLTASPSVVSYELLLSGISALPVRYKAAGNCKWYMSTSAIEASRGLKDANDLPIWRQDFGVAGAPMVLLGYPVVEVEQLEGQSHSIMFGDMRQAYAFVRNTRGLGLVIDRVTAPGHTKFYSTMQCAGGVMDSRAMVALAV